MKGKDSAQIFLSFKTPERDCAYRLKQALDAAGFRVWWQEEIQCGQEWHGEIDLAIARAGCIVVLWSKLSMQSPWVRHEASQAIVRGVYTPVRLEPMEIERPYDRVQATDLINWSGEKDHAGLQNLLRRVHELLPPPIPAWKRISDLVWRNKGVLLAAAIATLAMALLLKQNAVMSTQVAKQEQIFTELQRSLQPLTDVSVHVYVRLDPAIPGLQRYLEQIKSALLVVDAAGKQQVIEPLPPGVHVVSFSREGIHSLAIEPGSSLWPALNDSDTLGYVVSHVDMVLNFTRDPARADASSARADLSLRVGSGDPDGSEEGRSFPTIQWHVQRDELLVAFNDTPASKHWESTGRIVSVIDLERSTLEMSFLSIQVPDLNNAETIGRMRKDRGGLKLSTAFLRYSGKELMIRSTDAKEAPNADGLQTYTASVADIIGARDREEAQARAIQVAPQPE